MIRVLALAFLALPGLAHAAELRSQIGHTANVGAVAFSPDGKLIASTGSDKVTMLWELASKKLIRVFSSGGHLQGVEFTPDGKRLVVFDKTAKAPRIFEVATGKLLHAPAGSGPELFSILRLAVSPDGKLIAAPASACAIQLWDATKGVPLRALVGHRDGVKSVAFSPDGKVLLSSSDDKTLKLWDVQRGAPLPEGAKCTNTQRDDSIRTVTGLPRYATAVAFSADGKQILSAEERLLRVRDAKTGDALRTIPGLSTTTWRIAPSRDGRLVATSDIDGNVRISDFQTGELLHTLIGHTGGSVTAVAISPDGRTVASGGDDKTVRVWDAVAGKSLAVFSGTTRGLTSITFSPDGKYVLPTGADPVARLWELGSVKLGPAFAGHEKNIRGAAFSADGKMLATAGDDATVRLLELPSGKELKTLRGASAGYISSVMLSPDGKYLATGSQGREYSNTRLWELPGGTEVSSTWSKVFEDTGAFTADGRWLIGFRSSTDKIRIHDLQAPAPAGNAQGDRVVERQILVAPEGYGTEVLCGALSSEGIIATGHTDKLVKLWRQSGESIRTLTHEARGITAVAFSPDGRKLASAIFTTNEIWIWDIEGRHLATFKGHTARVAALAFSPDGHLLGSASDDGTARLWRIDDGASVSLISSREGEWLAYTDDGYFDSSARGNELVAMVEGVRAHSIEQLALRNNRPDLILERMGLGRPAMLEYYRRRHEKRLAGARLTEAELSGSLADLPESVIKQATMSPSGTEARLSLSLRDKKGLRYYQIYDNGVPIFPGLGKQISGKFFGGEATVPLGTGERHVEVGAINTRGQESPRALAVLKAADNLPRDLYFVGFGVGNYRDEAIPSLRYPGADVRDLGDTFSKLGGYRAAHVTTFADAEVTRENIQKAKETLAAAKPADTAVLFIAGHGLHDGDALATYYYLTHDTKLDTLAKTAASFEEVEGVLAGVAARQKLFLMDTCESGEREDALESGLLESARSRGLSARAITRGLRAKPAGGANAQAEGESGGGSSGAAGGPSGERQDRAWLLERDRFIFQDLERRTGAMVFSSSRGSEFSYESDTYGHGLFTFALLGALSRREADQDRDGRITIDELRRRVTARVAELSRTATGQELQHPTVDRDNAFLELSFEVGKP